MPLRTRFFDDYVHAAQEMGCRQFVLLGAGLDTHAFRLRWPEDTHSTVYEMDGPRLCAYKDGLLARLPTRDQTAARCRRVVVPVDLSADWQAELLRHGFNPDRPTAWLCEALAAYLTPTTERPPDGWHW
ncbi:class I SAM-dependent methyltransferase [Streptomyces angustmyceticus]|uniref:S-adenosyl-L-methionine-dependent methyltransferase n=1 Tax=Streptomyces angustmyceticus TaxID=285578 RepID=A0A5J4LJB2_9ACTN|nr:class I SAM-dependent methyltransferase [Streptomyces angustmyceticus]UAL70995.1 SAM-dependent methyltransferase [Streptomyces angustmyceticus]GES32584.1 hypothetical protein San01_50710 [Streptomyces angustmyceticus]